MAALDRPAANPIGRHPKPLRIDHRPNGATAGQAIRCQLTREPARHFAPTAIRPTAPTNVRRNRINVTEAIPNGYHHRLTHSIGLTSAKREPVIKNSVEIIIRSHWIFFRQQSLGFSIKMQKASPPARTNARK